MMRRMRNSHGSWTRVVSVFLVSVLMTQCVGDGLVSCEEFVSYYMTELPRDHARFNNAIKEFQEDAEYVRGKLVVSKSQSPKKDARSASKDKSRSGLGGADGLSSPTKGEVRSTRTTPWNVPEEPKDFRSSVSPLK